jgi:hypothetical protein
LDSPSVIRQKAKAESLLVKVRDYLKKGDQQTGSRISQPGGPTDRFQTISTKRLTDRFKTITTRGDNRQVGHYLNQGCQQTGFPTFPTYLTTEVKSNFKKVKIYNI